MEDCLKCQISSLVKYRQHQNSSHPPDEFVCSSSILSMFSNNVTIKTVVKTKIYFVF